MTAPGNLGAAEDRGDLAAAEAVVRAYFRAVYARDFGAAYNYISAEDRRIRTLDQYLRQRGPFSGFALDAARSLAASVEILDMQSQSGADRLLLTVRYKAPDPKKLAEPLRHWNGYQLNSLAATERRQLIESLEHKKRDGSLDMIQGEEALTLVKEGDEWRIFLEWSAGVTISFQPMLAEAAAASILDVSLSPGQIVTQPGDLFEIVLRIKNRSGKPVVSRIGHVVEPKDLADYLELVQCGFLLPVKLPPGTEQEFSGTYLLRGNLPEGVHRLILNYEFRLAREK